MNLIYYTIGGDPSYVAILKLSLDSLWKHCDMHNTHVLVLCSEAFLPHVEPLRGAGVHDIMMVPQGRNAMELSMQKVRIWAYPKLTSYDRVLFLDSDILVQRDIVSDFLETLDDKDRLYVCEEHQDMHWHNTIYFGLRRYTPHELQRFQEASQHVFNCGQFAFCVNPATIEHFRALDDFMWSYSGPFFYEQSFMNDYFNTRLLTNPRLTQYVQMPLLNSCVQHTPDPYLIHFAAPSSSFHQKLAWMVAYLEDQTHLTTTPV